MYESLGTIFIQTTTEKGDMFTELMNVFLSVEFAPQLGRKRISIESLVGLLSESHHLVGLLSDCLCSLSCHTGGTQQSSWTE